MRTYSALVTAQKAASILPKVAVAYYTVGRPSDAGGVWSPLSNLRQFNYYWEPFALQAVIVFDNSTGAYNGADLRGKWIRVGHGVDPYSSLDISPQHPPYVKVWDQQITSQPGKSFFVLYCLGGWSLLAKWLSDSDIDFNDATVNATYANKTLRQILEIIIDPTVTDLDLGADLDTPLDGKIDTYKPVIQLSRGMSGRTFIRNLMYLTKCTLVSRTDNLHLRYPQDTEGVTYTYNMTGTQHYVRGGLREDALYLPMKVRLAGLEYTGIATDSKWASWMGEEMVYDTTGLATSQAEADFLAAAYLDKAKGSAETGEIYCRTPNCLQEVFDRITVTDGRASGAISCTGRVGGILYEYNPFELDKQKSAFGMTIRMGGVQVITDAWANLDLDMPPDGEHTGIFDIRPSHYGFSVPLDRTPLGLQVHTHNVVFSATSYNAVSWTTGTIKFANGVALSIDSGSKSNISQLTYIFYHIDDDELKTTTDWDVMVANPNNLFMACVTPNADTSKKAIISIHYSQIPIWLDDGVAPAAPTNVAATGYMGGTKVTWDSNNEPDLSYYEVYRNTVNNSGTATLRASGIFLSLTDYGTPGQIYYYWIKAIDVKGNKSAFSTGTSATAGKVTGASLEEDSLYASLFKAGIQPYSSNVSFSPRVGYLHDQLQWDAGTVTFADGGTQNINAGNTTTALPQKHSWVYFTIGSNVLTITQTYASCFGDNKGLLCEVYHSIQDTASDLGIAPYRAKGTNLIVDFLAVKRLSAIVADLGSISAGTVTGATIQTAGSGGRIKMEGAGATKYLRAYNASEVITFELLTNGTFWLGLGSADKRLHFDGSNLYLTGSIVISSASGYSNISDKPTALGDINAGEGTKLTGVESGADVTGSHQGDVNLASLGEKNTSSLSQVANYKLVTDIEKSGAYKGYYGLNTNYRINKYIAGVELQDPNMTGYPAGLYLTLSKMGYWTGTGWTVFFSNTGDGYFKGSLYATTLIAGNTLTVGGAISAAGGKVIINSSGLHVYSDGSTGYVDFYNTVPAGIGYIAASTGEAGLLIQTTNGARLTLGSASGALHIRNCHLRPNTNITYDLGTPDWRWRTLYIRYINTYGNLLEFVSCTRLIPDTDATRHLGQSTREWSEVWCRYLRTGGSIIFYPLSSLEGIHPYADNTCKIGWGSYAYDEIHAYDFPGHTPHLPILEGGYLAAIGNIKIDSKSKIVPKTCPAYTYRPSLVDDVASGRATDAVSLNDLIGLLAGGIMELEDRVAVLEAS